MSIIYVPYYAGIAPLGIDEMWAEGFRKSRIWRSTDWDGQSGTFTEWTTDGDPRPRPDLVEGQEDYTWTDDAGDVGYAYKVQHQTDTGKLTDLSDVITVVTSSEQAMQAQRVDVRYVHPEGYLGDWVEFNPTQVKLTVERLRVKGNLPYYSGKDYILEVALLWKDSAGTWKGIDLSGVTEIALTVVTKAGASVITRKKSESEITILDQGTEHPTGTRGHFRIIFEDTDAPDAGVHLQDCVVTFAGGEIVQQFSGELEIGQ